MKDAILDIAAAQKRWRLVGILGWQDLKHRYKRSLLGPFWLTVSTGVQVATICLVFGSVLQVPMSEYAPFVAIGLVLWLFITSVITSSCTSFISADAMIKQSSVPMFVYVERVLWRELAVLMHNLAILPLAFLLTGRSLGLESLAAIPGFLLLLANLGWIALLLAVLSTRYRDLPQTVTSILPTLMFVTPIMWLPQMMPGRFGTVFTQLNPLGRLIDLVREPLLGRLPGETTWIVCLACAIFGWALALYIFARGRKRIVFWL